MWLETKIRICFVIVSTLIIGSIVIANSCASSQDFAGDSRRPSPGDMDWPTYDWMYQQKWHNTFSKVDEDKVYDDDYKPASAVFFDRHKETGICFAFYGRSFVKAPSWACDKK